LRRIDPLTPSLAGTLTPSEKTSEFSACFFSRPERLRHLHRHLLAALRRNLAELPSTWKSSQMRLTGRSKWLNCRKVRESKAAGQRFSKHHLIYRPSASLQKKELKFLQLLRE
jgi:hypothetical protein